VGNFEKVNESSSGSIKGQWFSWSAVGSSRRNLLSGAHLQV